MDLKYPANGLAMFMPVIKPRSLKPCAGPHRPRGQALKLRLEDSTKPKKHNRPHRFHTNQQGSSLSFVF
jgi:hypothetical protein